MKFFSVQCGAGQHAWVPWAFVEPHARRAEKNHRQSLERLNERGGLDWRELLAVVEDRPFGDCLDNQEACELVMERLVAWARDNADVDATISAGEAEMAEGDLVDARARIAVLEAALREAIAGLENEDDELGAAAARAALEGR